MMKRNLARYFECKKIEIIPFWLLNRARKSKEIKLLPSNALRYTPYQKENFYLQPKPFQFFR